MPVIQMSPIAVMDRFPEHEEAIRLRFREEDAFRVLCEDYRRVCGALSYWSGCSGGGAAVTEAEERHSEYEELKRELEVEILERLGVETCI